MTINPGEHRFLPYSVAGLWAYAQQDAEIAKNYQLRDLFFEKNKPIEVDNPAVFGFSVYIWNENYTDTLAQKIKKQYPGCIIVYGGPQVPKFEDHTWWSEHDYVDVVVFGEGERAFKQILLGNFDIPNTSINHNGWHHNWTKDKRSSRQMDLSELPSPYLNHVMPEVKSHSAMLFETNRGCPYACTFCDWGGLTYSKLVNHDMDRLREEIEYAGKNKIGFLYSVDANFGILKKRDEQIADWIIETKARYGYPKTFFVNWAKNANEDVLRIAKKMYDAGLIKSFIMSLQTLTEPALELIKRDNMDINEYDYFARKCLELGLPFDCELIIGNPGETVDSWKQTYLTITEYPALSTYLYPLALLPNAEIATPENRKRFGFTTTRKPFPGVLNEDTQETIEMVTSTKWLSEQDLKYIWEWTWCTRLGHEYNFTRDIADFMVANNMCTRLEFYDEFYEFVRTSSGKINNAFKFAKSRIDNHVFGLASQSMGFRESLSIDNREHTYCEIADFVKQFDLETELQQELVRFCEARLYNPQIEYPLQLEFAYDIVNKNNNKLNTSQTVEFTPTLFGANATTAQMFLEGNMENLKAQTGLTCTLNKPTIIV
jgi:radical SAM superfamily enzyme YgiQ (UPF0313 family)